MLDDHVCPGLACAVVVRWQEWSLPPVADPLHPSLAPPLHQHPPSPSPSPHRDAQTDSLIQKTIRRVFKGRTTITIAHRLDTIIFSDKILAMASGEMKVGGAPFMGGLWRFCVQGGRCGGGVLGGGHEILGV